MLPKVFLVVSRPTLFCRWRACGVVARLCCVVPARRGMIDLLESLLRRDGLVRGG